jgi:nitroimidazol reductase NimA-like FMN-containing flavoprotein (pyridoxamine 5'-phosphate oxidase superfamily)
MSLSPRVQSLLDAYQTLVLAVVSDDGQPEAASIYYAVEQDESRVLLVAALLSHSSKLVALRHNDRAGVFIGPQRPDQWLQAECTARIVEEEPERSRRLQQLVDAVPDAGVFVERVPVTAVLFEVRRIKLTDLTGGQPPIEVFDLMPSA